MRIVIPDDVFRLYEGGPAIDRLRRLGEVAHYTENAPDPEALLERLAGCEAILTTRYQTDFKSTDLLDHLPGLRIISVMGTRPRMIDMKRARARNIAVSVTPGASSQSVAEHTIALILGLAKRLAAVIPAMQAGGWPRSSGVELGGKTLGLMGFGHIGMKVCRMALGLGMRVIVWSKRMTPERAEAEGARAATMEECLGADVVSLHLHVNEETRGIMSAGRIALMKPEAFLVNTSRAALVEEGALVEALRAGRIAGYGADVFEPDEPLPADSPYRALENTLLTPHSAWDTDGTLARFASLPVGNIEAFLRGEPQNLVEEDA
ncbi:MAG: NAD(P)-dependent oxidoreductase [bacterium]